MYLFVDTTQEITVGLLDKDFNWLDYKYVLSKKSSADLHFLIHDMLSNNSMELLSIKGVFFSAGPGSYTGMRVSEGMKDIFNWQGIKVYSFYHFDVPRYIGRARGLWISKAFKGELFLYEWDEKKANKKLLKEKNFHFSEYDVELFSGHEKNIEIDDLTVMTLTKDLIYSGSRELFEKIWNEQLVESLFYYRSLEQEFSTKNE